MYIQMELNQRKNIMVGGESREVESGERGIKGRIFRWEGNQGKYIQVARESREVYLGGREFKGSIFRWDGYQGKHILVDGNQGSYLLR